MYYPMTVRTFKYTDDTVRSTVSDNAEDPDTLQDISHTSPTGDTVTVVWERGHENDD